jgi:hypothetical protein
MVGHLHALAYPRSAASVLAPRATTRPHGVQALNGSASGEVGMLPLMVIRMAAAVMSLTVLVLAGCGSVDDRGGMATSVAVRMLSAVESQDGAGAGSAFAVVVAGAAAALTHQPWLFPSLGPSVMLHVEKPDAPESSPRNTLIGHAVALVAGYGLLVACGLGDSRSVLQEGVSVPRIVAAAGSLAVTAVVLLVLRAPHPPAGATTRPQRRQEVHRG